MIKQPLISVITVSYNSAEFIEYCLKSVVSQDLFDDFEYIVIDGGSTDGTADIIRDYEQHLVYWHSKPDRGVSHAFNLGLQNSRGQWLLFLNSDDTFAKKNVLSRMREHLLHNPDADVVLGQVLMMSRVKRPKPIGGPYGAPFNWRKFKFRVTIPHQAAFTNRNLFRRIGLFNEDYKIGMDYEHFLRGGSNLKVIFEPVIVALMRDGGVTKCNIRESYKELCKAQVETGALSEFEAKCNYLYLNIRSQISRTIIGNTWRYVRASKLQKKLRI